jgi:hypothetical protein
MGKTQQRARTELLVHETLPRFVVAEQGRRSDQPIAPAGRKQPRSEPKEEQRVIVGTLRKLWVKLAQLRRVLCTARRALLNRVAKGRIADDGIELALGLQQSITHAQAVKGLNR